MIVKKKLVARAARTVIEELEQRRLLSGTLALVNGAGLPNSNRMVFDYIQNKNTSTPNVERSQETLTLKNTATTTLTLNSVTVSGPFSISPTVAAGTSIPAGGQLVLTISFTQRSLPAHSANETNENNNANGGAAITGSLTITSSDTATPTQVVTLAGYWQDQSEDNAEPGSNIIINTLFGYTTALAYSGQVGNFSNGQVDNELPNTTTTANYYGQEVVSPTWQVANASSPATLTEIATYHTQGNSVNVGYFTGSTSSPTTHSLWTETGVEGQTLLPSPTYSGSVITGAPYSDPIPASAGAFGLRVDNEYSDDAINIAKNNASGGGHHFRFYPLIDASGNVVPNTYIVLMDYAILQSENYDFQDNVFLLSNVVPTTTAVPATPTNFTASSASQPVLTWTASTSSNLAGYNIYRSTSASGTFTKLNSTPITGTSYTDTTAPSGTALYYRLTAVSTAAAPNESAPATVTTHTPTGPVAGSFTVTAYEGQAVDINLLADASDSTPGASILPGSVSVFNVTAGDTATVNSTNGVVTYTVRSNFTPIPGTETFSYTVGDGSSTSAPGTVTLNVVAPAVTSPTINDVTSTVLANPTSSTGNVDVVNVLASDVPVTTFKTSSLTVSGNPAHGTAAVGTGDELGEIVYTPAAGFIGSDTFKYSVADNNGQSGSASVTVFVGAEISKTSGNKAIHYTDSDGTNVVAKLNLGTADLYFSGTGTIPGANNRGVLLLGGTVAIADASLTGTTAGSTFSLTGARRGAVTLGGITDNYAIGAVAAPTAKLSGTVGLYGGVRTLSLATVDSSSINIGPIGSEATAGAAVLNDSIAVSGAITNSSLNDLVVPIVTLKAASWTNTENDVLGSISAPSIRTLSITGQFDPSISLTGTGTDLTTATIRGPVTTGYWNVQGSVGTVSLAAVAAGWGGLTATGSVRTFAVRSGGYSSNLAVGGTLTTFSDVGTLSGDITAANAGTVHNVGAVTGATLDFTGAGTSLRTFSAAGAVTDSTLQTSGNLTTFAAASLAGSTILVGTPGTPTVGNVTLATLGGSTLGTLSLASKAANTFADSTVIAAIIRSASLGSVNNSNGGTKFGVATKTVEKAITDRESGTLVRVTPVSTTHTFGDFEIELVTT